MAAACAALAFLPYIVHSGTSAAPVRFVPSLLHYIVATAGFRCPQWSRVLLLFRPQALAADVSELLVWLFTTAAFRLYWHSAHLHQLPLSLMLLWCAKAACSIVLAVLQASLTYEHIQLSFQVCRFTTVAVLLIAVLFCTQCWSAVPVLQLFEVDCDLTKSKSDRHFCLSTILEWRGVLTHPATHHV